MLAGVVSRYVSQKADPQLIILTLLVSQRASQMCVDLQLWALHRAKTLQVRLRASPSLIKSHSSIFPNNGMNVRQQAIILPCRTITGDCCRIHNHTRVYSGHWADCTHLVSSIKYHAIKRKAGERQTNLAQACLIKWPTL